MCIAVGIRICRRSREEISSVALLVVKEHVFVVFEERLDCVSLCLHVGQLSVYIRRTHNRRGKNHCEVERCHLGNVSIARLEDSVDCLQDCRRSVE
jgi:hypothetical protein